MADALLAWFNRMLDDPGSFEQRLAGRPVLVYEPRDAKDDSQASHRLRTSSGVTVDAIGGGEPVVALLEKSKDNMFQKRVTLGRTRNNDVVLQDASVSRFHAWIQRDDDSGEWAITDAGSKNGTWKARTRLAPKKPVALENGVRLRIGTVEVTYYTAKGFMALLKKRVAGE